MFSRLAVETWRRSPWAPVDRRLLCSPCYSTTRRQNRLRLVERDADKAEHQQHGEPEWYAAEHLNRGDGIADRSRFGRIAEPGDVRHHPGNRCAERSADRAYRGQGGRGTAVFVGGYAVHRPRDKVHVVYAYADPHHEGAQRHECEPWQQSHR